MAVTVSAAGSRAVLLFNVRKVAPDSESESGHGYPGPIGRSLPPRVLGGGPGASLWRDRPAGLGPPPGGRRGDKSCPGSGPGPGAWLEAAAELEPGPGRARAAWLEARAAEGAIWPGQTALEGR